MTFAHRTLFAIFFLVAVPVVVHGQKPPAEAKPEEVDKEYLPLVKQLKDKDPKVRLKAANDLAAKGEAAASTATALCDTILDTSPRVGEAAFGALEKVRPDLYPLLVKMIVEKDRVKQSEAIAALGLLGEKALPAKKLLVARLRAEATAYQTYIQRVQGKKTGAVPASRQDGTLRLVLTAVRRVSENDSDVHKVLGFLASGANQDYRSRLDAIEDLVLWAGEDEMRRKIVLPVLGASMQEPKLLIMAINRLGSYGKLSKGYLSVLQKLKLAPDEAVRTAATSAVEAIEGK